MSSPKARSGRPSTAIRSPARRSGSEHGGSSPSSGHKTRETVGGLFGREEEIAELVGLLERARLVTLTGAPGIGKTRLAHEVAGRYGGDARVVELAPVIEGALVAGVLASALSIPETSGQSITDTLLSRLRERQMLVVLDNCEHLLGACAELVDALLAGCPDLRIMATSREPLGLAAERVWPVAPLPVPEPAQSSPEAMAGYAAVGLFVERAAAVQPGFAINAYVAPAVGEICRRLDGIPLAIELAAARAESLTPQEIARRLEDRFGLLTVGDPDVVPRHQTLQAALDWSHELLSGPERSLLRRLSVFVGGFGVEAAEAVCAGGEVEAGDVVDLLARIVAKSLVVVETDSPRDIRYRLLETIRAYGGERLEEAGETAELRRSHARFYLGLAERAEPELTGPGQQDWLARLAAERADLRSAIEWSLSHGQAELALRLAGALVLFWRVHCHFSEGRELLDAALSASDGAAPTSHAKALWGAGFMALMVGDTDAALPLVEESLSRFRELGDRQGLARALLILGSCRQYRDHAWALSLFEESATLAREADDSWCLAHALALAGFVCRNRKELPAARALFEECLLVAREAEDKQGLRFGLMGMGSVIYLRDDLGQEDLRLAELLFKEAVTVTGELGEDYSKALALQYLGRLALIRGEFGAARELLDEALGLMREVGSSFDLPSPLSLRAMVAHAEGDRLRARLLLEEALALARSGIGSLIPALRGLGELAAEERDVSAARRLFDETLQLARQRGDKTNTAQALRSLGQVARTEGEAKQAAVLYNQALQLEREIGSASGIAVSLEAVAGLTAESGRYEQAAQLFGAVKAYRDRHGYIRAPWGASRYEADLALVRDGLCAEELQAAIAKGAELSLEEAASHPSQGGGPVRWPASGWSSLTDRERQVAALVADGLTNPEIAECLFISLPTVKTHLSHIFRKLGVARRRELAREVRRRGEQAWGRAAGQRQ